MSNNREKYELTNFNPLNPHKDTRLNSAKFRDDVHLVLWKRLGYKEEEINVGLFKLYDARYGSEFPLDWTQFAQNIRHPKQAAKVSILWNGEPTGKTVTKELAGATREEALKMLDTRYYRFIGWR